MPESIDSPVARDLDETRRVALILRASLVNGPAVDAGALATVVNAAVYHSQLWSPEQARELLDLSVRVSAIALAVRLEELVDAVCDRLGDTPLFRT